MLTKVSMLAQFGLAGEVIVADKGSSDGSTEMAKARRGPGGCRG